ncbi:MAG: transposase [Sulfurimonas sp.]|nr:MAG: transposase [Sulfurimonas sp.]PHS59595.1 MAG: transposase [Sulfurimonas sp.]
MQWTTECIYCQGFLYCLADGRIKCSSCNRKISKRRMNKIITLIIAFIKNENALSLSSRLSLSYVSVQKYYKEFREIGATICEMQYEEMKEKPCQYEEYFYLEGSKKFKKEAIFDAYNFLTFDYENHIYTLLMPSLKQYKMEFIEDGVTGVYADEFSKFKRDNKIIKISEHHNNIVKFWDYFEKKILNYKGVKAEYFIYYLKEYEFKYNHTQEEAIEFLIKHYFKD